MARASQPTSGNDSNLSDPKYSDYDVVTAVTQASVQVHMTQYLAAANQPEIVKCYVFDSKGDLEEIALDELKSKAKGSDPFDLVDGQPQTDAIVENLKAAHFAGAFKARVGIPAKVAEKLLPPVVSFQNGSNAPVIFNMLCSEFQIVGLEYYPPVNVKVINKSQPTDGKGLWYFSSHVTLNTSEADLNAAGLPDAVKARIQQLQQSAGQGAFSMDQLLLNLETAILVSQPKIVGLKEGWPVWIKISQIFLTAYFAELKKTGDPVLGYSAKLKRPDVATLQLGAISHETLPYLVNGHASPHPSPEQRDAAVLMYLGSTSTNAPAAVPFTWNWVSTTDLTKVAGVMAVRRAAYFDWFKTKLNTFVPELRIATSMSLSHSGFFGQNLHWHYSYSVPGSGPLFAPVANPKIASDGWMDVLSFDYSHPSSDSTHNGSHTVYLYGTFSSKVTGRVALKGNQVRVIFHVTVYIEFHHHEAGVHYHDLSGENWVDMDSTSIYTLGVNEHGSITVSRQSAFNDRTKSLNWHHQGILGAIAGLPGDVNSTVTSVINMIRPRVKSTAEDVLSGFDSLLNGFGGWVFPGTDSFITQNVSFSHTGDLVTQLMYKSDKNRVSLGIVSNPLA